MFVCCAAMKRKSSDAHRRRRSPVLWWDPGGRRRAEKLGLPGGRRTCACNAKEGKTADAAPARITAPAVAAYLSPLLPATLPSLPLFASAAGGCRPGRFCFLCRNIKASSRAAERWRRTRKNAVTYRWQSLASRNDSFRLVGGERNRRKRHVPTLRAFLLPRRAVALSPAS